MSCRHPGWMTYLYALGRKSIELCPACKASLEAIGMTFRERRETNLTPIRERREDRKPAWLSRLQAKDFTERLA